MASSGVTSGGKWASQLEAWFDVDAGRSIERHSGIGSR
jgi:hypothetical protein